MKSGKSREIKKIPGGEIISRGLKDMARGKRNTVAALCVAKVGCRLEEFGFKVPHFPRELSPEEVNQRLYHELQKSVPDAYSQYNALQRRLVSFCHAMER